MTVAYRHPVTAPTETDVFNAICAAAGGHWPTPRSQRAPSRSRGIGEPEHLISLSLPLPPLDLIAALVDLQADGHEFYWENPGLAEGLAATGCVAQWTGKGPARFEHGQEITEDWLNHTHAIGLATASGTHVLCRFTFDDGTRERPIQHRQPWPPAPAAHLHVPRWQVSQQRAIYRFTANVRLSEVSHPSTVKAVCKTIWQRYSSLRQLAMLPQIELPHLRPQVRRVPTPTRQQHQQFLHSVASLLEAIERRRLVKVVLASTIDLTSRSPFSAVTALRMLRHSYSGCHIFATRCGEQLFLGASPERLFRIRQQQLSTNAIAGSSPRGNTAAADRKLGEALRRSDKELHEHRIVADFIVGQLRQLGLQPSWSSRPEILRLANIQHLHTPLTAAVPADIHPLQIVASLHPTPAMAGLPQQAACDAIAEHEPFERSLYAAPLGWINQQRESEFIVGIRSALIDDTRIRLYAGAGIVRGSVPNREWTEINMKLQAIASVLSLSDSLTLAP
ncbi:MAG: isochorismate synthase [Elainellaceae cyanobacterium]